MSVNKTILKEATDYKPELTYDDHIRAPNLPYFTPRQDVAPGTALVTNASAKIPKLFTPLKLRGLELHNRIITSPMCQYSADNGYLTPYHLAHYGGILLKGPALVMLEATAISPAGRISPFDAGIWSDSQLSGPYGLKSLVSFAHSLNTKIGIQLSHAGRKSSMCPDFVARTPKIVPVEECGWEDDVRSASSLRYGNGYPTPKEMTVEEIETVKTAYKTGARRAAHAGFDVIEIQAAHGYLLHNFLSPVSNIRTDKYGGCFENRFRLLLEVVAIVRSEIPKEMPLFVRISATEWLDNHLSWEGEETWVLQDSIRISLLLADLGVDVLDVSSGGNHPDQQITSGLGYQVGFAKAIKEALAMNGKTMLVQAVGMIRSGIQAESVLTGEGESSMGKQELDLVAVGYEFLMNPGLVFGWARELGVEVSVVKQMT